MNEPKKDAVTVGVAANILMLSANHVRRQCAAGLFKSAWKPGGTPNAVWLIERKEVLQRLQPRNRNSTL